MLASSLRCLQLPPTGDVCLAVADWPVSSAEEAIFHQPLARLQHYLQQALTEESTASLMIRIHPLKVATWMRLKSALNVLSKFMGALTHSESWSMQSPCVTALLFMHCARKLIRLGRLRKKSETEGALTLKNFPANNCTPIMAKMSQKMEQMAAVLATLANCSTCNEKRPWIGGGGSRSHYFYLCKQENDSKALTFNWSTRGMSISGRKQAKT